LDKEGVAAGEGGHVQEILQLSAGISQDPGLSQKQRLPVIQGIEGVLAKAFCGKGDKLVGCKGLVLAHGGLDFGQGVLAQEVGQLWRQEHEIADHVQHAAVGAFFVVVAVA